MSRYVVQSESLVAVANEIRNLRGTEDTMSLSDMKTILKNIPTKAAATITPKTTDQTIASDTYLTGTQTIKGDANLVADNIKDGVSIFGVSGTCLGINFEVIGSTTKPSNPVENTIWINTNVTIPNWIISTEIPTSVQNGTVWIQNDTNSSYYFNALTQNELSVQPLIIKQYVEDDWQIVDAEIWQNSEWNVFRNNQYIYEVGNQYTDVTGGWGRTGWTTNYPGVTIRSATINSSGMSFSYQSSGYLTIAGTMNKIDLSKNDTIYVTVDQLPIPVMGLILAVFDSKNITYNMQNGELAANASISITSTGEFSLDITNIDDGYIVLFSNIYGGYTNRATQIRLA